MCTAKVPNLLDVFRGTSFLTVLKVTDVSLLLNGRATMGHGSKYCVLTLCKGVVLNHLLWQATDERSSNRVLDFRSDVRAAITGSECPS